MNEDNPPSNGTMMVPLTVIFIAVAWISTLEKALAAAVTFGVFAAILQEKWSIRNDRRLWAILSFFVIIHIAFIALVKFPVPRAGLVSLPFALVDGFSMYGLINWIEKHHPRSGD